MRDILLILHIVGAAGWLGGGLYGFYAYSNIARLGPPAGGEALQRMEKMGGVYFGATSGLVLLSGIGLVLASDAYGWTDTFVLVGLGAFLVSALVQSTVGKKANERLTTAATTGVEVDAALRSWRGVTIWDVVILLVVVWAMVTKLGV